MSNKNSLSYKDAHVNIEASNTLISRIKSIVQQTKRQELIGKFGSFSAICKIPKKYSDPILVLSTDGVGTKLRLAIDFHYHDTIGIDLVAMCVNDIVVQGAEPLFFLDYYATGQLDIDIATTIITGITEGCHQSGCALVGGETAEMPDMYRDKDYDLAGFCVGVVEKANIIDTSKVEVGDILIALASSGLHANGYSLVRKILSVNRINPKQIKLEEKPLIEHLLKPTRIYVKTLLALIREIEVHAIVHLTGGSFLENIPRILPKKVQAVIYENSWQWPEIFTWLQKVGGVNRQEMYRTFNCGVGMIVVVSQVNADQSLKILSNLGESAWMVGEVQSIHSRYRVTIC